MLRGVVPLFTGTEPYKKFPIYIQLKQKVPPKILTPKQRHACALSRLSSLGLESRQYVCYSTFFYGLHDMIFQKLYFNKVKIA
jgi:hypothetical protein